MPDIVQIEADLATARAALTRLNTGTMQVEVEYEGRRVKFAAASATRLEAHVRSLEDQLARAAGGESGRRRRSARVTFG